MNTTITVKREKENLWIYFHRASFLVETRHFINGNLNTKTFYEADGGTTTHYYHNKKLLQKKISYEDNYTVEHYRNNGKLEFSNIFVDGVYSETRQYNRFGNIVKQYSGDGIVRMLEKNRKTNLNRRTLLENGVPIFIKYHNNNFVHIRTDNLKTNTSYHFSTNQVKVVRKEGDRKTVDFIIKKLLNRRNVYNEGKLSSIEYYTEFYFGSEADEIFRLSHIDHYSNKKIVRTEHFHNGAMFAVELP